MSNSDTNQQGFSPQNALERLGISYQTQVPENVLTSAITKGVRFRESSPRGYAHGDIESFIIDSVAPSLDWYAEALYEKDIMLHRIGEELDRLEVENYNLKGQLDNKDVNEAFGMLNVEMEAEGEWQALMGENTRLKAEVASLQGQLARASEQVSGYTDDQVQAMLQKVREETRASVMQEFEAEAGASGGYSSEQVSALVEQARIEGREQALVEATTSDSDAPADTNKVLQDLLDDKEGMTLQVAELQREKQQLLQYVSELEEYNKSLGGQVAVAEEPKTTLSLPPINPEDL